MAASQFTIGRNSLQNVEHLNNGKTQSGVLVLTDDYFTFDNKKTDVDWADITYSVQDTTVKKFLFSVARKCIVFQLSNVSIAEFLFSPKESDNALSILNSYTEAAIKRREEAEKERIRKAEEEERRRREEEARRERERLERERIRNEKQARIDALFQLASEKQEIRLESSNSSLFLNALSPILNNPFRILGISVTADRDTAYDSLEKIKKLIRLKIIDSYKTSFHLRGIDEPARDVSIAQNALTTSKELACHWFWFKSATPCMLWKQNAYRKELYCDGLSFASYDLFLANYFYALYMDSTFTNFKVWEDVLKSYSDIVNQNHLDLLRSQVENSEFSSISDEELLQSFCSEIFKPLTALTESEDYTAALNLFAILQRINDSSLNQLKAAAGSVVVNWMTKRETHFMAKLSEHDPKEDQDSNSEEKTEKVVTQELAHYYYQCALELEEEVKDYLDAVVPIFHTEKVRYEMITSSYKKMIWWALVDMIKYRDVYDDAIDLANRVYPYCNEDDRRTLRNHFGFIRLENSKSDATHKDWDILGDYYLNGNKEFPQDFDEAISWYRKAANAGNMFSQNSLGVIYRDGTGVNVDQMEAAYWFRKAADNGSADGAFNLAECYVYGTGVRIDREKALDLYLDAHKRGHPTAGEVGSRLLEQLQRERKHHRLMEHHHYDLGYLTVGYKQIIVETSLNYSANVYLMDDFNYRRYLDCDNFSYYGGWQTQTPCRIGVPHSGHWHLVVDNGNDKLGNIRSSCVTRTYS